jgi:hypothetical protein
MSRIRAASLTLAAGLLLSATLSSQARAYTFTRISDFGGSDPSLNAFGAAAFFASQPDVFPAQLEVFRGDGGPVTTIANTSGQFAGFVTGLGFRESPSVNDAGQVAFFASLDSGGSGVFVGDGATTTPIALASGGFGFVGTPSLNSSGVVAFPASRPLTDGGIGIYVGSGGAVTPIANQLENGFTIIGAHPSINDSGAVSFIGGDSSAVSVLVGSGGSLTTIASLGLGSSDIGQFNSSEALNEFGDVAFRATLVSGIDVLYLGDGGPLFTVADSAGPFAMFDHASINDLGQVAFYATLDDGGAGIFTGPDPVADRVIAVGDPLDGRTVTYLGFFNQGLNEFGQIAFTAGLDDGTSGVFVTSRVPEPAGLGWLAVVGMTAIALARGY